MEQVCMHVMSEDGTKTKQTFIDEPAQPNVTLEDETILSMCHHAATSRFHIQKTCTSPLTMLGCRRCANRLAHTAAWQSWDMLGEWTDVPSCHMVPLGHSRHANRCAH